MYTSNKMASMVASKLESGKALPADTYWIKNIEKSSDHKNPSWIAWYESHGGSSTARCVVHGCGGAGE